MRLVIVVACAMLLASASNAQVPATESLANTAPGSPPQHNEYVTRLSFSSDGQLLASTAGIQRIIKIWRVSSGKLVRTIDVSPLELNTFGFGGDPGRIAVGAYDRYNEKFQIWDARTGTKIAENEVGTRFDYLSHSADGFHAWGQPDQSKDHPQYQALTLSAADASVIARQEVESSSATVRGVAFTSDGKYVSSAFYHGNSNYTVNLWEVATGRSGLQLRPTTADGIALSRDSTKMALATRRGVEVLAFDGQPIHSISVGPMSFVAFSPNGVFIGAGGDDGKVALISANSGEEIISEQASRTHVQSLAMSPDSKLLAAGFVDGTIRLWNTADGKFAKFKAPAAK